MKRHFTAAALAVALAFGLSACSGSDDDAGDGPRLVHPPESDQSSSTPSEPRLSSEESQLIFDAEEYWGGSDDDLIRVADQVCRANSYEDAVKEYELMTTGSDEWGTRVLVDSIVGMYCTLDMKPAAEAELNRQLFLSEFAVKWSKRMYLRKIRVIDSANKICDLGESGESYATLAAPMRNYDSEARSRRYIDAVFEDVCPQSRVAYTPPPPPPAQTDFYEGTYRVAYEGANSIEPGTYSANTTGDGCYWERNDSNGNIIDNYFGNGLRVQVTIYSSDYSFSSTNCGHWKKVG